MKRIGLGKRQTADPGPVEQPPAAEAAAGTPPAPSTLRSRLSRFSLRSRQTRVAAGLGAASLVVVFVAVIAGGAFSGHSPSPQPTSSASGTASGTPETTATPAGSATPTARQTRQPFATRTPYQAPDPTETPDPGYGEQPTLVANGWPVEVADDSGEYVEYAGSVLVGPDGTIYVDGYAPLTPAGRPRADWSGYPANSYAQPAAIGSDGTIYAQGWGADDADALWALDPNGKARAGWPVTISGESLILPGPSGTVYALSSEAPHIRIFGPDGKARARVNVPGVGSYGAWYPGPFCDQVVTPEGLLFVAVPPDCSVRVYGPTGVDLTQGASGTWDSLLLAQDGAVAALGRDWEPAGHGITRTRLALLGTDGRPLPGWPVIYEGTAYGPAIGPDGTMYVTVLGLGRAPSRIEALGRDGSSRPGWPVLYPDGYGPLIDGERPAIGAGGTIHIVAANRAGLGYVLGLDPSGAAVPGWPYQLPRPVAEFADLQGLWGRDWNWVPNPTPLFVPGTGGGLLYVALDDRIVALDSGGKVAPGWPYKPRVAGITWSILKGMPGSGILIVYAVTDAEEMEGPPTLRCLTATGGTPK